MAREPRTAADVVVAGCGAVAVDRILFLDRGFAEGKGRVLRQEVAHGGNVATALAAIATMGGGARWLGYLPSGSVRDDLSDFDIDLSAATLVSTPPIQSTILVDPVGERIVAFDDDTLVGMPPIDSADTVTDSLKAVDVLLVDSYTSRNGMPLVYAAAERGIPVVADVERLDFPGATELLDVASHLVIPLEIGQSATGCSAPEAVLKELWNSRRVAVVVTDGGNGSWFATEAGPGYEPAFAVDVVDTNGCGDVFHGAYALRVAQGFTVRDAVRHASAAGAVCATGAGGRGHLPTKDDLEALLSADRKAVLPGPRN